MFLSGGQKGLAVQCLLGRSKWQPQKIVFVDDTLKNDVEFAKTYSNLRKKGDLLVIHYTHENAKEANFMLNKKLQNKCAEEWRNM